MSQRSEKLHRRVADNERNIAELYAMQRDSNYFSEILHTVQTQTATEEAKLRRGVAARCREAEHRAAQWQTTAYLSLIAFSLLAVVCLTVWAKADAEPATSDTVSVPVATIPELEPAQCWEAPDIPEDFENEKIEAAMLAEANVIEDCTVTWYTASVEECGKDDGITYSGLPVVEHLTCAVDRRVIPLYADVFVEYEDGTIEQLWATDTGVTGNAVDIYTPDHDYAIQCGRQSLTVWWVGP